MRRERSEWIHARRPPMHSRLTQGTNTDILSIVQLAINSTTNATIGVSPSEALLGYNVAQTSHVFGEQDKLIDVTRIKIW